MRTRVCKQCGEVKDAETGYYRSITSACRPCWRAHVKAYRANNLERVRAYDRERGRLPHRIEENKLRNAARPAEWHREKLRRHRAAHPEKDAARQAVTKAIMAGKLVPAPCEKCGAGKTHGHHEDYTKKLEVRWLCDPCHKTRHREINEARRCFKSGA